MANTLKQLEVNANDKFILERFLAARKRLTARDQGFLEKQEIDDILEDCTDDKGETDASAFYNLKLMQELKTLLSPPTLTMFEDGTKLAGSGGSSKKLENYGENFVVAKIRAITAKSYELIE